MPEGLYEFAEGPIQFEVDVQDGAGKREFWYTPTDRTLYVEDDDLIKSFGSTPAPSFDGNGMHASMRPGMIAITEQLAQQNPKAKLYWDATKTFREHFDVEAQGGAPPTPEDFSPNGTDPPEAQAQPTPDIETPTKDIPDVPLVQPPDAPEDFGVVPEIPALAVDIETYAELKYAPVLESQQLIIETYEMLMTQHLDADSPVHDIVDKLSEKSRTIKEKYCVRRENA